MHKQPEVTDATREAFIDAFCKLASEKPINEISIKEITDLAGYNRTTFYRYFSNVETLLDNVESRWIESFVKLVVKDGSSLKLDAYFFKLMIEYIRAYKERVIVLSDDRYRIPFVIRLHKYILENTKIKNSEHNKMVVTIYLSAITGAARAFIESNFTLNEEDLIASMDLLYHQWYLKEIDRDENDTDTDGGEITYFN